MKRQRILFFVIPEKGHINPAIGVAQHLQSAGYEVAFYSPTNLEEQLGRAGLEQYLAPAQVPNPNQNRGKEFSNQIRDWEWLRDWIKRMLIDGVTNSVPTLQNVISTYEADIVVTDPMIYAAVIASQLEVVPWIALSNSLNPVLPETVQSDLLDTVQWLSPEREKLFANFGLAAEFRGCDALSPVLTIAFTTEEFTGFTREDVAQVGPSLPLNQRGDEEDSIDWEKVRDDLPLVYVSFGSQVFHQPDYFLKIIEAVRGKKVQLVAAIHELQHDARFQDLPQNVIACGYAPQLEILKRADLLITHGGANSVMEALASATPILIQPICNDQFHQAWFIENAGCGVTLDLDRISSSPLWQAIEGSLNDVSLAKRVNQLADSYRQDGARTAAQLIQEVCGE